MVTNMSRATIDQTFVWMSYVKNYWIEQQMINFRIIEFPYNTDKFVWGINLYKETILFLHLYLVSLLRNPLTSCGSKSDFPGVGDGGIDVQHGDPYNHPEKTESILQMSFKGCRPTRAAAILQYAKIP
ncbi:hypothetical protein NPIL_390711, partial [Nephila pilipes]